jgi:hypothetical protein
MRKFRFIGDPNEWDGDCEKDKFYAATYIPKGWHYDVATCALNFPDDWEEVFDEPKKLHKETDLGYFSFELMKAMINSPELTTSDDADMESFVSYYVSLAKELIKQLDQEQ